MHLEVMGISHRRMPKLIEEETMESTEKLKNFAPDVWTLSFPLMVLGLDLQRNVTILRLSSGKLVIHSTAPFSLDDVTSIHRLGEPRWVVDTLLRHDTFALHGTRAFPAALYLVPDGFEAEGVSSHPLLPPPSEWHGEIETLLIEGAPSFNEVVMLHRPSRTLIVADLLFNFLGKQDFLTSLFFKIGAVGGRHEPGMTRPFKRAIENPKAFAASVRNILQWDFDSIIVGHGDPILQGKEKLRSTLKAAGIEGL